MTHDDQRDREKEIERERTGENFVCDIFFTQASRDEVGDRDAAAVAVDLPDALTVSVILAIRIDSNESRDKYFFTWFLIYCLETRGDYFS